MVINSTLSWGNLYGLVLLKLLLCVISVNAKESPLVVHHIAPEHATDQRNIYCLQLLEQALAATRQEYGPFVLAAARDVIYQKRALRTLDTDYGVDVVWTMTSKQRERDYTPIRIPLFKGLMGYRLFLIREQDSARFSPIYSLAQLKKLHAGQGADWPDTQILKANGIPVFESQGYDNLFSMLLKQRFDYFPRGVPEVYLELESHPDSGLIVEPRMMFYYPTAIYFFVSRRHPALAKRIESGLNQLIQGGEFDRLFFSFPYHKRVLEQARLNQRLVFNLHNPHLPDATPLEQQHLWYRADIIPKAR